MMKAEKSFYKSFGKAIIDRITAVILIVILSPFYLLVSVLIWVFLKRPILFCQERPGLQEKAFILYKFRTMKNMRGNDGRPLPDTVRLTNFGKFLRRTSIDELPELFNVLKGEMSLVGPRPLLMCYIPLYSPEQRLRHEVKPGISGWAQVNGRNALEWEEKFALDVWYVEHCSFLLDMKILLMTLNKVFKHEGISQEGQATMNEFRGSLPRGRK